MSLPNIITLSRIPLMFAIVWLMYQGWLGAASLAFWLFIAAAVGDWYDGYLARKRGLVSNFGKLMDALTDKIMVLGLIIALVDRQHAEGGRLIDGLPNLLWLALITLVREFLVTGMRMVAATKGIVVSADGGGKSKTMSQLIGLGFLIGTPMVARDWAHYAPWDLGAFTLVVHWIGYLLFALGTALAVWSGVRYILRYKAVVFGDVAG
jgi:CDP-diacylglycerol---glycerol-3-phosphate 3-phosphatidyltransferase